MSKVKWPWGAADSQTFDYAATVGVTIANTKTLVTIAQATGNCTVNVTPSAEQAVGDSLMIKTSADGTNRTITWGTGLTGNAVTNTASKNFVHHFEYDGSTFVHKGSQATN